MLTVVGILKKISGLPLIRKSLSRSLILFSVLCFSGPLQAQSTYELSLLEAQQFAYEKNYDLINSERNVEIARKQVKEYMSYGFPQVNARVSFNDYIALPTFIVPAGSFGPESPEQEVQFGTKYNAFAEISANQLILDGKYFLGVQASRKLLDKTSMEHLRNQLNIKEEVAKAYYTVLVTRENNSILDTTLKEVVRLVEETRILYESGFAEETDVDQLEIIQADLEATSIYSANQMEIAYNFLKYLLGLQLEDSVVLTENFTQMIREVDHYALMNENFDFNNNIDFKIMQAQEQLAVSRLKVERSEYYPNISAFFSYQTQAQRNTFNLLDSDGKWYPTALWGLELAIPILSSGYRSAKVQSAKINLEQVKTANAQLKTGLMLRVQTARSEFNNAYMLKNNKQKSMESSEKIYIKTAIKYKEGLSTSLELLQAHNQFLTNESDYMLSILALMEAKLALEKLLTKY
jgi:outer membrane protein TolC